MARRLRLLRSEGPRDREAGFALVEVIVSAAVLALVAVAVLGGVDASTKSAGREKSRSVAATLAEQDQERMRAMPVTELADFSDSRDVDVDGITYKIVSKSIWTRDDQGATPSCTTSKTQVQSNYLQITSTVTSAVVGKNINPVVLESLVAPTVAFTTSHGSLAVKVIDRQAVGVENISVAADGPITLPAKSTNQDGCAVWESVPIGDYTITLNTGGYVDHLGHQLSTAGQTVTSNTVAIKTMDYDLASLATVTVKTWRPGQTTSTQAANQVRSKAENVSAVNPGETGLFMTFAPTSPPVNSMTASSLFPFSSNYSFFTGACEYDNPTTYDSNYFSSYPGAVKVGVPPATNPVEVYQPPLNIQINRTSSNTSFTGGTGGTPAMTVKVVPLTPNGETCSDAAYTNFTTMVWNSSVGPRWVSRTNPLDDIDSGLPFGRYDVCFYQGSTNKHVWFRNYDNTAALGKNPGIQLPRDQPGATQSGANWNWPSSGSYAWSSGVC